MSIFGPIPDSQSASGAMIEALRKIAQRYRDLQARSTGDAGDAFGMIATEYEARADRLEAGRP
jgi:hypothetical protein